MTPAPTCAKGSQHVADPDELDPAELDWSELPPLGDEREFATLMEGLIADEMPRLFAVVQEYGERVDGRIAAWGMAFEDHAELIFTDSVRWTTLRTPDNALRVIDSGPRIRTRLVWLSPAVTSASGKTGQPD